MKSQRLLNDGRSGRCNRHKRKFGFAFGYLVTVMGLVIPWSTALTLVDVYAVFLKGLPLRPKVVLIVIVGDLVLSFHSLAAGCSTASVTELLMQVGQSNCPSKFCSRYQMSPLHFCLGLCYLLHFSSISGY